MKIQATNNYSLRANSPQQNPNFGKLIFMDNVSTRTARELIENKEVQKLAKILHDIGKDLEVDYFLRFDDPITFFANSRKSFTRLKDLVCLGSVKTSKDCEEGFAEKAFKLYKRSLKDEEAKELEELETAKMINDFNESLDGPKSKKQSFWKRLFG